MDDARHILDGAIRDRGLEAVRLGIGKFVKEIWVRAAGQRGGMGRLKRHVLAILCWAAGEGDVIGIAATAVGDMATDWPDEHTVFICVCDLICYLSGYADDPKAGIWSDPLGVRANDYERRYAEELAGLMRECLEAPA